MRRFIERAQLTSLAQLARLHPEHLQRTVKNLGRCTIATTRLAIEPLLGTSWEEFATSAAAKELRRNEAAGP